MNARTLLRNTLRLRAEVDQLEARMQGLLSGRVRGLQLLLHDGGLVLRGFTRTYYAKQLAQHLLMRESELPILGNEIEVC